MLKNQENKNPIFIGLLQSLGISAYCAAVALFFYFMAQNQKQPGFFGFFLMLTLLVASAAVTGSLMFGYPAYLALAKNKIKEALTILAYSLAFTLLLIVATTILILIFA